MVHKSENVSKINKAIILYSIIFSLLLILASIILYSYIINKSNEGLPSSVDCLNIDGIFIKNASVVEETKDGFWLLKDGWMTEITSWKELPPSSGDTPGAQARESDETREVIVPLSVAYKFGCDIRSYNTPEYYLKFYQEKFLHDTKQL